jgi:hypothetical protein
MERAYQHEQAILKEIEKEDQVTRIKRIEQYKRDQVEKKIKDDDMRTQNLK